MLPLPLTFRRATLCAGLLALAGIASAEIDYHVSVKDVGDSHLLHVSITLPTSGGKTTFQSPRWAPGSYDYSDFGKSVAGFSASDTKGNPLQVDHPDFSTWTVTAPRGPLTVQYDFPAGEVDEVLHYSGPHVYMYVVGREQEPCQLKVDLPSGWRMRTGLDPVGTETDRFTAPTYDVLADTPVTLGKFREVMYMSHDRPHYMVLYGRLAPKMNTDRLEQICKFTSDAEGNFFGEVPYKRYVWSFNVSMARDGGSGLEHLNGTEISLGPEVGTGAQSVITHEFFHLWNVKRIRAKVLGPFDYTTLPKTGALWWLEGVTDYYAIMIPSRYGWWGPDSTWSFMGRNIRSVEGNDNRTKISPYDSSFRVNEANNGRGNSNGLLVSYYDSGWLCGLMLDIEIRIHSHGKHSLDDVELALWNECKNSQPGFPEGEIRRQVVRFGGPDLGPLFDTWVMKPGELPVEAEIAKLGLKYGFTDVQVAALPMETGASSPDHGLRILGNDDHEVITEINGRSIDGENIGIIQRRVAAMIGRSKPGDKVTLTIVKPGASPEHREVTLSGVSRRVGGVTADPNATASQLALRKAWLSPRPGTQAISTTPMAPEN